MTWTLANSGTQSLTAITTTATTVDTETTNGTYAFEFDLSNMANGDTLLISINTITLGGGSYQPAWKGYFQNAQGNAHKISPPIAVDQGVQAQITRLGGSIPVTSISGGGIIYGTTGTGQTTAATALMLPQGASPQLGGTTMVILALSSASFNTSEVVWATTVTNSFTMNGSPTALSVPWKALRI